MRKYNFGIIGPGSHYKKNIEPVLVKNKKINIIKFLGKNKRLNLETDSKKFFQQKFDFVYISSPNELHASHIIGCLMNDTHVICEKPFVTKQKQLKKIIYLAKKKSKLIFEVFPYIYHPAFIFIKDFLKKNKSRILFVNSNFTIPFLENKNNRYNKSLGNGFFLDTAVYPLSLEEFLFNSHKNIKMISRATYKENVELRGNFVFINNKIYKNYKWGDGQKYSNIIEIIGKNFSLNCKNIFSKKNNEKIVVEIMTKKGLKKYNFKIWSQFENMFNDILKNFNNKNYKNKKIEQIYNNFKIRKNFL